MTTKFLPNIGQHQKQQQRQQENKQQKQTIEQDTKSFQVSATSSSKSFSKKDDQTTTKTDLILESRKKLTNSFLLEEDRRVLVVSAGGADIGFDRKGDKQTNSASEDKARFIDSRSILLNKERLKRFWEHKMEMEFKLRQQQQQSTMRNNKQQQLNGGQQKGSVEFDENNNRGSNNKHTNNNSDDFDSHQQQQQVQCNSDEEWRSLSPNVEPTTLNGPFNVTNKTAASAKQVSVELICEKLREYQANNGEPVDNLIAKGLANNCYDKQNFVNQNNIQSNRSGNEPTVNGTSKQVPNTSNNNVVISNSNGHDESQLMSIDPTLCHSSGAEEQLCENNNTNSYNFNCVKSNLEGSSSLAEDIVTSYNEQREEQTVNEEFSSSSNSSFGPMSISLSKEESTVKGDLVSGNANNSKSNTAIKIENSISDEDDLSSAQSGSVLTVINKFDSTDQNQAEISTDTIQDLMSNGQERPINTFCNVTYVQSDSSMVGGSENRLSSEHNVEGDDDDESSSNIGVAFESLQFDSEIKSSKQEKVDDELLIAPAPVKRPVMSKFNANEVKSVCNFITNAITDATRQVESYITGQSGSSITSSVSQSKLQSRDTNQSLGSIQRATFVQQSDTLDNNNVEDESITCEQSNVTQDTEDDDDYINDVRQAVQDEEEVPDADLSSIFEANVRREIERFETNSMIKKSLCGKLTDINGLTKWRIAEEIRQFNEREKELKRRLEDNRKKESPAIDIKQNNGYGGGDLNNIGGMSPKTGQQQETAVTVVRFGKTFQIPKPSSPATATVQDQSTTTNNNNLLQCKSIKLSTSSNSSNSSSISMHKFIASGGKRFVFATTANATTLQHQSHLTKSMSNLSTNTIKSDTQAPRTVDYKAVDSLKCKETPNVKPGLTRKVIETFSRLSHISRFDSHQSLGPSTNKQYQSQVSSMSSSGQQAQQQQHQTSNNAPTAEWKIHEELREMRAREAELRTQRNHLAQRAGDQNLASPAQQVDESINSIDLDNRLKNVPSGDQIKAIDRQAQVVGQNQHLSSLVTSADEQSFTSESLYPIKQTIDSFRKLNSSSQANHIAPSSSITPQHNGQAGTHQRRQPQQVADDYDSKVGGQRRKISMIERWENRFN